MTGDAQGAVVHLKAALKDPDNPDIPYDLGLAYAGLGDLAAARRFQGCWSQL